MALQIWLPFIGDLRNQGLCNNIVTDNVTFNNSGKLGQCLELPGQSLNLQVPQSIYDVYTVADTEISYSLWVKIDKAYLNNLISTTDFSEKTQIYNKIIGFSASTTSCGICIELRTNSGLTQSTVLDTLNLYSYLRNGSYYSGSADISINLDQWYHLCVTYNKSNRLNLYINGNLIDSRIVTRQALNTNIATKVTYLNYPSSPLSNSDSAKVHLVQLKEYFNDVRIYDHALSAKEVEEIAKGLVLWYQLNGGTQIKVPAEYQQLEYIESTGTQSIDTGIIPTTTHQFNFKYALMEFNSYRGPFGAYQSESYKCTRIICNNGSTTSVLIYHTTQASGTGAAAQSANITTATGEVIEGYLNKNGFKLKNLTTNTEVSSSTTFNSNGTASNNTMRLFGSHTTYSKTRIYYFDTYNNGVCVQKLIPVKRLNDNVLGMYDIITQTFFTNAGTGTFTAGPNVSITGLIYDSSGYSHNGTIVGSLTAAAPSPRYGTAAQFPGNALIEAESLPAETKTISAWIKWNTIPSGSDSSTYVIPIQDKNSGLTIGVAYGGTRLISYTGAAAGGTGSCVSCSLSSNIWYHIVIIKTGDTTRDVYINNIKQTPTTNSYWGRDLDKFLVGCRHQGGSYKNYIDGQIVDVRVYVTALSEDDVAELYNTSMLVDASGNVTPRGLGDLV